MTKTNYLLKIPRTIVSGKNEDLIASYCYLMSRKFPNGEVSFSLQHYLSWMNENYSFRKTNHGYKTTAGKFLDSLQIFKENYYLQDYDESEIKGNAMIELQFDQEKLNEENSYVLINSIELQRLIDKIKDSDLKISQVLMTYLFLKASIHVRIYPGDTEGECYFTGLIALSEKLNIGLKRLKEILIFLTEIGLLMVWRVPRKKFDLNLFRPRPTFISCCKKFSIKYPYEIDNTFNPKEELRKTIEYYEKSWADIDDFDEQATERLNRTIARIYQEAVLITE